ncbi:MAG: acyloxyacyl hydrolase, partial [Lutibacter sp.]|nr:acyloxyacyl hydrolase [Lutibacter sp.]
MRKIVFVLLMLSRTAFGQQSAHYIEAGYFYGNILALSPDSHAFLQGHPSGFFTSYNVQNLGTEAWHAHYNYPDTGYSFSYQNLQSDILGEIYALYKHYNFYLFERLAKNKLILSTGLGLGYATHPYDKVHNNKNIAFASHLNTSSYFRLSYQRAGISPHLNLHLGLLFMHTSNSNIKSP